MTPPLKAASIPVIGYLNLKESKEFSNTYLVLVNEQLLPPSDLKSVLIIYLETKEQAEVYLLMEQAASALLPNL